MFSLEREKRKKRRLDALIDAEARKDLRGPSADWWLSRGWNRRGGKLR